jgi:hypothetical protein
MRAKKRRYPWQQLVRIGDYFIFEVDPDRNREMTRKALHTAAVQKGMRVSITAIAAGLYVERVA